MMAAMMDKLKLPYDAQVEYLESSGTQWIDTVCSVSDNFKVELRGNFVSYPTSFAVILGAYESDSSGSRFSNPIGRSANEAGKYYIQIGDVSSYKYSNVSDLNTHVFVGGLASNKLTLTIDGSTWTTNYKSPRTDKSLYLFARNSTSVQASSVRVYYCKLWNNDVLVRDFIPVRVGTVGYLFDNVSKELFGNVGTGNFTLGPDIVPIEYLQSYGGAYIDSGIEATGDLSIECKFNQINSTSAPSCGSIYNNGDGTYKRHHLYGQAYYYSNSTIMSFTGDDNFHICKVDVETGECYLDNVKKGTFTKRSFNCGANYGIFARISANMSLASKSSYFSWFKIWDKGVLVRDFIPVRIGTVGYMYDKVSRQLFANAGAGGFILGNDI